MWLRHSLRRRYGHGREAGAAPSFAGWWSSEWLEDCFERGGRGGGVGVVADKVGGGL